jgi:hypothetical protein
MHTIGDFVLPIFAKTFPISVIMSDLLKPVVMYQDFVYPVVTVSKLYVSKPSASGNFVSGCIGTLQYCDQRMPSFCQRREETRIG